jgi:hypothetical protein
MPDFNYSELIVLKVLSALHLARILMPELGEVYVAARDVMSKCRNPRPRKQEKPRIGSDKATDRKEASTEK